MRSLSRVGPMRARAEGLMLDRVSLRAPGAVSAWNETTKRTETTQNVPFATNVPARVKAILARGVGASTITADDAVRVAGYRVLLPFNSTTAAAIVADGESNTLVDVTSSIDPLLVGQTLRVVDVPAGSSRFERELLCTLND